MIKYLLIFIFSVVNLYSQFNLKCDRCSDSLAAWIMTTHDMITIEDDYQYQLYIDYGKKLCPPTPPENVEYYDFALNKIEGVDQLIQQGYSVDEIFTMVIHRIVRSNLMSFSPENVPGVFYWRFLFPACWKLNIENNDILEACTASDTIECCIYYITASYTSGDCGYDYAVTSYNLEEVDCNSSLIEQSDCFYSCKNYFKSERIEYKPLSE